MASLPATFRDETTKIHLEHTALMQMLDDLDFALDQLVCYSEVYANLKSIDDVHRYAFRLAEHLPEHFTREEASVLDTVARISPELLELAHACKRQHDELRRDLVVFCRALDNYDNSTDLEDALCQLKEQGTRFTAELKQHVQMEERELGGFL